MINCFKSNTPKVGKGFYVGIGDLATTQNFVITPDSDTFPIQQATVCSLKAFLEVFFSQLLHVHQVAQTAPFVQFFAKNEQMMVICPENGHIFVDCPDFVKY